MTGTELYSELSVAAYERGKQEREKLAALEARRQEIAPLDAQSKAALLEQLNLGQQRLQQLRSWLEQGRQLQSLQR